MATKIFRGDAPDVAQVDLITVGGTVEVGDRFQHTINGKTVEGVASTTNLATTASDIETALEAEDVPPEFAELSIDTDTSIVEVTAAAAGVPFTLTADTVETDGAPKDSQTYVKSSSVNSSGHWNWDVAANWNASGVPASGDAVVIGNVADSIKYGLAQSGVTLASLTILQEFTKDIGLPTINEDGANSYFEYRDQYLTIGATVINIGQGPGDGSGRIKLNVGTVQTELNIFNSGQSADDSLEPILWKGTNINNVVEVSKGVLGIAVLAGETAAAAVLRVGYMENQTSDSKVRCGSGFTCAEVQQSGGILETNATITEINQTGGTHVFNTGNVTTLNVDAGTFQYRGSGTITTLIIGSNGAVDFSKDMSPRTITNPVIMYRGAKLLDPHGTVTFSGGIVLRGCRLADVTIDVGITRTIEVA